MAASHGTAVPVDEAITNVACLVSHALPDNQPNMEALAVSLGYNVSFDTNFGDRCAFVSGVSKYVEEAQSLATLNDILEDGFRYSGMIYTWRSCSRAIPSVKRDDQPDRLEIYQKTVEVLGPEVAKLKDFYYFQARAIDRFGEEIRNLAHPEKLKGFVSQTTKLTLGRMINMFAVLDALKNMKACLNNDFSFHKRAYGFLKSGAKLDANDIQEEREIAIFLATQNSLTTKLRDTLEAIERYEEVLAEIVNECATFYENGYYVLPEEKHMLLKIMAFSIFLMDGTKSKANIYKNKKINLTRFDKLFKQLPVVPLFGDMHISLMSYVQMCPHWDESKWMAGTESADARVVEEEYVITAKLPAFRQQRNDLNANLALINAKGLETTVNMSGKSPSDLALEGLRTVSNWTATIMELYAWKLAHPTDKYMNREAENAEAYERATRYNFTSNEKFAIVEIIAMIKDVTKQLWQLESFFSDAIRRDIHSDIQKIIQHDLRDAIRHVTKKKKTQARTVLLGIRNTCADWAEGIEPDGDPSLKGEKDSKFVPPPVRPRDCGPGSTQLFMLRTMLESLCMDDKKKSMKADLPSSSIPAFVEFYTRSFFFRHLLNFSDTLASVSDLSQLWYREFYLELSMGKHIQFPIEMSLPWIFINHILSSKNSSMLEFVLFPFDLYNDSANFALVKFRKQFLYDEVEAEVDLAFDQFIFQLSEQVFAYFKMQAASMQLDKSQVDETPPADTKPLHRYAALFRQRHFQLLGRSVDINKLLAQRMNISLKRALDLAISRFESSDLAGILELESLIENNRITHRLLSEHCQLDDFGEMLQEVNDSVTSIYGRITVHVFAELCTDVLPNFAFNSVSCRFIRPSRAPTFGEGEPNREAAPRSAAQFWYGSKAMNAAFNTVNNLSAGFVGREHFACLSRMLGYAGIAMCVDEMIKAVSSALKGSLSPYVSSLMEGMPRNVKLPLFDYGPSGAVGFFQLTLKDISSYRDLQTEVFHAFRVIGNAIICFMMIEESMTQDEVIDLVEAMPFQGVVPAAIRDGDNVEERLREASEKVAFMRFGSVVIQSGDEDAKKLGQQADLLTRERLCKGLSMFDAVLERIKSELREIDQESGKVWTGPDATDDVIDMDECNQFHRLWSAIQFTMIISASATGGQDTTAHYFGDGMVWAGCALISLLEQTERFEAFDFCYHVISTAEVMPEEEKVISGISVAAFVRLAKEKKRLNTHVFSLVERYMGRDKNQVVYYPPPGGDTFESAV